VLAEALNASGLGFRGRLTDSIAEVESHELSLRVAKNVFDAGELDHVAWIARAE